ncbi:MAG: two-component sensor histidine kinase, partial [Clostridia bacterium]|nr:two-component sensor histidine kinase [Clostridia bacterium]
MKRSLRAKLTISYISIALLCVVLIGIFSNLYLERQFRSYVKSNQESNNLEIVALVTHQYQMQDSFRETSIENIGISALDNGLIMQVRDELDNIVWDAFAYNNGLCQSMISDIHRNMIGRYPNWKGEYITQEYPVMSDFKRVGTVSISYYGPFYFTDRDLKFINSLNIVFVGVALLSLILAVVLGNQIAKRISNPINNVINTAHKISKGSYDDKIEENSDINEIESLTSTINNLADILKLQEQLRKKLTGDVAHELRTPLATLQSHLEAMIDGIWEADGARLKSCHDEIIRISRLVGDLEKLAQYERENLVLNKSEFDVTELIKSLCMNFEKDAMNKKIVIQVSDVPVSLYADKDKISQVIINLVSNSIKYSDKGDKINITAEYEDRNAVIRVKDTG